jgi:hypothetical protein
MPNALAQAKSSYFSNGVPAATETLAFASNNTAGNLLFVSVYWQGGATITASVSDSRNTYTALTPQNPMGSTTVWLQGFYSLNCGAGANTVTASFSGAGGTFVMICIGEWSGVNSFGQGPTPAQGSSATPTSSTITTTSTSLLIGYSGAGGAVSWTAGSGYALLNTVATSVPAAFEDQLNVASGAASATFSIGSAAWAAGIASFFQSQPTNVISHQQLRRRREF